MRRRQGERTSQRRLTPTDEGSGPWRCTRRHLHRQCADGNGRERDSARRVEGGVPELRELGSDAARQRRAREGRERAVQRRLRRAQHGELRRKAEQLEWSRQLGGQQRGREASEDEPRRRRPERPPQLLTRQCAHVWDEACGRGGRHHSQRTAGQHAARRRWVAQELPAREGIEERASRD